MIDEDENISVDIYWDDVVIPGRVFEHMGNSQF
jgi:hypothetical protein